MRHFVSRALLEANHDYQEKIRQYKLFNIVPEDWVIEQERDQLFYMLRGDRARKHSDDFVELVWYQLDEQYN